MSNQSARTEVATLEAEEARSSKFGGALEHQSGRPTLHAMVWDFLTHKRGGAEEVLFGRKTCDGELHPIFYFRSVLATTEEEVKRKTSA